MSKQDPQPQPETDDLIERAAAGQDLDVEDADALFDHFMETGELPGVKTLALDVTVDEKPYRFVVRRLEYEEWDEIRRTCGGPGPNYDAYAAGGWYLAKALVSPKLGARVKQMQAGDRKTAPHHAAALLMRMFARATGTLLELSDQVLEFSELGQMGPGTVRRVQAQLQAAAGN